MCMPSLIKELLANALCAVHVTKSKPIRLARDQLSCCRRHTTLCEIGQITGYWQHQWKQKPTIAGQTVGAHNCDSGA